MSVVQKVELHLGLEKGFFNSMLRSLLDLLLETLKMCISLNLEYLALVYEVLELFDTLNCYSLPQLAGLDTELVEGSCVVTGVFENQIVCWAKLHHRYGSLS